MVLREKGKSSDHSHYVKSVHIWSFPGPYFPAFILSVFSPNARKYRAEKLRIETLFTLCHFFGTLPDIDVRHSLK